MSDWELAVGMTIEVSATFIGGKQDCLSTANKRIDKALSVLREAGWNVRNTLDSQRWTAPLEPEGASALDELVGMTVAAVWVGPAEHELRLVCTNGKVLSLDTEGDCCSETWWADIVGVKQLVGHLVTAVKELEDGTRVDDGRSRQEEDMMYGIQITTTGGTCDLVYRNSSNGYYGGNHNSAWGEAPTGGGFTQITEDWRA